MKKKILTMVLLVSITCMLAACGGNEETSRNNEQTEKDMEDKDTSLESNEEVIVKNTAEEEWGVPFMAAGVENKDGEFVYYKINYPSLIPPSEHGGYSVTYQKDSSLIVKFKSNHNKYTMNGIDTMLEDCNSLVCEAMWDYLKRDLDYDDTYEVSFEVDSTELTTINDFPMCKYVGTNVFDNGEETHTLSFVGYAADLQVGEGAYVMWMVLDNSEFSKMSPLENGKVEEYALKMAESLELRD